MNLKELVAVSGMSGIYKMAGNRTNGLILEDLDTGKRKFAPARKYQFTPLESIAIFTDDDDSVELAKVFQNMVDQLEDNPPIPANSSSEALRDYFTDVLPNHDRDKVHISDIKKLLKWFAFLQERNLLTAEAATGDATEEEE